MSEATTTEFIESLGIVFQNEGLPRIAGRILGYMIVSEEPKSFHELTNALQISKGSVSTNTRLLENLGVVERTAKSGDRQDYFRLGPNPYERMIKMSIERSTRARDSLRRSAKQLGDGEAFARDRIAEFVSFYDILVEVSVEAARKLRDRDRRD